MKSLINNKSKLLCINNISIIALPSLSLNPLKQLKMNNFYNVSNKNFTYDDNGKIHKNNTIFQCYNKKNSSNKNFYNEFLSKKTIIKVKKREVRCQTYPKLSPIYQDLIKENINLIKNVLNRTDYIEHSIMMSKSKSKVEELESNTPDSLTKSETDISDINNNKDTINKDNNKIDKRDKTLSTLNTINNKLTIHDNSKLTQEDIIDQSLQYKPTLDFLIKLREVNEQVIKDPEITKLVHYQIRHSIARVKINMAKLNLSNILEKKYLKYLAGLEEDEEETEEERLKREKQDESFYYNEQLETLNDIMKGKREFPRKNKGQSVNDEFNDIENLSEEDFYKYMRKKEEENYKSKNENFLYERISSILKNSFDYYKEELDYYMHLAEMVKAKNQNRFKNITKKELERKGLYVPTIPKEIKQQLEDLGYQDTDYVKDNFNVKIDNEKTTIKSKLFHPTIRMLTFEEDDMESFMEVLKNIKKYPSKNVLFYKRNYLEANSQVEIENLINEYAEYIEDSNNKTNNKDKTDLSANNKNINKLNPQCITKHNIKEYLDNLNTDVYKIDLKSRTVKKVHEYEDSNSNTEDSLLGLNKDSHTANVDEVNKIINQHSSKKFINYNNINVNTYSMLTQNLKGNKLEKLDVYNTLILVTYLNMNKNSDFSISFGKLPLKEKIKKVVSHENISKVVSFLKAYSLIDKLYYYISYKFCPNCRVQEEGKNRNSRKIDKENNARYKDYEDYDYYPFMNAGELFEKSNFIDDVCYYSDLLLQTVRENNSEDNIVCLVPYEIKDLVLEAFLDNFKYPNTTILFDSEKEFTEKQKIVLERIKTEAIRKKNEEVNNSNNDNNNNSSKVNESIIIPTPSFSHDLGRQNKIINERLDDLKNFSTIKYEEEELSKANNNNLTNNKDKFNNNFKKSKESNGSDQDSQVNEAQIISKQNDSLSNSSSNRNDENSLSTLSTKTEKTFVEFLQQNLTNINNNSLNKINIPSIITDKNTHIDIIKEFFQDRAFNLFKKDITYYLNKELTEEDININENQEKLEMIISNKLGIIALFFPEFINSPEFKILDKKFNGKPLKHFIEYRRSFNFIYDLETYSNMRNLNNCLPHRMLLEQYIRIENKQREMSIGDLKVKDMLILGMDNKKNNKKKE